MSIPDEAARLKQEWARWTSDAAQAPCPECGGSEVSWDGNGNRGATVLVEADAVYVPPFSVRRLRCKGCRNRWRLLPPGLIPHKHYQPCVIARAVSRYLAGEVTMQEAADEVGCSRRTIGRWIPWVSALGDPIVVMRKVVEATDAVVVPMVRAAAKHASDVLRRAAEMLGLFEVLGSAWGLEPPGLRGVLRRVLRGRTGIATYARPLIPDLARGPPD